jgi:iron complex transport system permease protein
MGKRRLNLAVFYAAIVPILALSILAGTAIGSTTVDWRTIIEVAGLKLLPAGWVNPAGITQADTVIVWLIRIPRVVVAGFVGMGLAAAGAVMQGLFRNPLAEPSLVGPGSGAILGAVISFAAGWSIHSVVSLLWLR